MASNTLSNVRLQLRYDTYVNWMSKDPILLAGEVAVAEMTGRRTLTNSDDTPTFTPPAIGVKIGNGHSYFSELPWIQAVAADVYNWAKKATKPTYSANEIGGLAEYIESHGSGGSSGGSSGGGAYRITYDGVNNKYILQQYNEELEQWENTTSEINFTPVLNRIETIENWANGAYTDIGNIQVPMVAYIQEIVTTFIGQLDVSDSPVTHQFVTSVSETNGKITVSRSTIKASDITEGVLPVAQGGTGISSVEYNEVLVGGARGEFVKKQVTNSVNPNETGEIPTTGALVNYVTNATAGLTGAMHFVGEATVAIDENNNRTDPQIDGYDFRKVQAGDVILANDKQEYVWTGNVWRLLGDEGSYAIKGSIRDADIDAEANIQQSKIANLVESFAGKVDKVEGMGLSSNDYTDEEKLKLRDIEDNAQQNVIEHIMLNGTEAAPHTVNGTNKVIELTISEFDQASRDKLATIQEGAQENTIESISLNNTPLIPDNNKNVAIIINEFTEAHERKLDGIEDGAEVNSIETIYLNNQQVVPNQDQRVDLFIREYPQADENKLATVATGAQVNVIEHIKYDGTELHPDSTKTVTIVSDPHTEHINKIESIVINGTTYPPDQNKAVNITLDESALNLNLINGAQVPNGQGGTEEVQVVNKKLQLATIAKSGDVQHLLQTQDTYILFNCGSSTEVI